MQFQPLDRLVDGLAVAVQRDADEVERIRGDSLDRGAIGFVMAGREQLPRVERGRQPGFASPPQDAGEVGGGRGEDQDRLAHQRTIDLAGAVAVSLPTEVRCGGDQSARQEGGDIELLPGGELVMDDDGNLGVEAHAHSDRAQPAGGS